MRRVNAYDALVALAEQVNLFFGGDFLPALQSYYNADDDTEYIAPMRDALTEVLAALPPAPACVASSTRC